jgi:hypothetical protein
MTVYGIEHNIPLPRSQKAGARVYPWFDMEVGDSFFVPLDSGPTGQKNLRASVYNAGRHALGMRKMSKEDGYNVVVRKLVENEVPGFRAWLYKEDEGPTRI